ncbi:unnamed protein product [Cyprideis torosa]|uniref:Uncharacterized protein n=1 Tax=Cyprideis torosa TaxID=163714 RepID=A0A7R8WE89_9CRUS|nr:unnamed protein product [Cyprideis torosa]CAG0889463.1 unnamed protein product [Cyprideis torosa]
MSGPRSLPLLKEVFVPHRTSCDLRSHHLFYGHILDPKTHHLLDEVMVVYMASPSSYTREDVVEIHCHGNVLILQSILDLLLKLGVELAEPGEFTKRAFLNGRIDLTKAEAVIDVLAARTRKGVDLAQEQLAGALYNRVVPIRQILINLRAQLEVAIDFPDEDIDIVERDAIARQMRDEVMQPIEALLRCGEQAKVYREGISVVIVGRPNVGKSSLLNALLQEERALVTAVAGTTRDSIEECIDLFGIPVRIADTAGIRESSDVVEELGIKRSRRLINEADVVLFMIDGTRAIAEEDHRLYDLVKEKVVVLLVNKIDLVQPDKAKKREHAFGEGLPTVFLSAKEQQGIEELNALLFQTVTAGRQQWQEDPCIPNVRHRESLRKAMESCENTLAALDLGISLDLLAIDVQQCLDHLGDIVGETTTEDILDTIFADFCLGK